MSAHTRRRILFVSYPLLPVSDESAGGAEQMLWTLERELSRAGHATVSAAADGSRVSGELLATGAPARRPDALGERLAEQNGRVVRYLARNEVDLVHDQGGTFWQCAGEVEVPVLATLHLPRHFYEPGAFQHQPPNLFFNCVSHSQARSFQDLAQNAGTIRNGIALERFPLAVEKGEYLVWLGRICQEKGAHVALEVARLTGLPLVIAGQVYPFSYHQLYFEREVKPRIGELGAQVKWIHSPSRAQKLQMLRNARAVLVPSLVEETSSLVAMEAMACGTPVVAFRRGALPEVVIDRETGLLVDSVEEMAVGVEHARFLDPRACREHVVRNHSADRMARDYEALYDNVLQGAEVEQAA